MNYILLASHASPGGNTTLNITQYFQRQSARAFSESDSQTAVCFHLSKDGESLYGVGIISLSTIGKLCPDTG